MFLKMKRFFAWQVVYPKSHEPPKLNPPTAMTSPYSWTGTLWASHASLIHLIRSCDQSKDHYLAGDLPNRRKANRNPGLVQVRDLFNLDDPKTQHPLRSGYGSKTFQMIYCTLSNDLEILKWSVKAHKTKQKKVGPKSWSAVVGTGLNRLTT